MMKDDNRTKSNGGRTEYTSRKSFRRRLSKATTGLERLSQCNYWEYNNNSCNRSSLILFRLVNQKDADVSSAKLQVSFFNTSSSILREMFAYENTVKAESKSKISLSLFDTRRIWRSRTFPKAIWRKYEREILITYLNFNQ